MEFLDSLSEDDLRGADLVIVDRAERGDLAPSLSRAMSEGGKVIMIGASLEDDDVIALLRNDPMDHVISDTGCSDEAELVVTSVKLLGGDIFGLQKYLAWGVKVRELTVQTYEQKRDALGQLSRYAREVGARRQTVANIERVADELLMNALYDAPAIRCGANALRRIEKDDSGEFPGVLPALMRYASDGQYLAVSVEDRYGELHKDAILDHLVRARAERGRPKPADKNGCGGAGLGLYFILTSVTRFIANIAPGERTEVVCLFDLRQTGREFGRCARSLHIFHAAGSAAEPASGTGDGSGRTSGGGSERETDRVPGPRGGRGSGGVRSVAAVERADSGGIDRA